MIYTECTFNSPIYISPNQMNFNYMVIHKDTFYFIDKYKLISILQKVHLLNNFLDYFCENSIDDLSKWLLSNNILNKNFLEEISHYYIPANNFKNNFGNKINIFNRDQNLKPEICTELIKHSIKNSIIFSKVNKNIDDFNQHAQAYTDKLFKNLSEINNVKTYLKHNKFYQSSILKEILESYLVKNFNVQLLNNLQAVESLKIKTNIINNNGLSLYKKGRLQKSQNKQLKLKTPRVFECMEINSSFDIEISPNQNLTYSIFNPLLENIKDSSYQLTQAKIHFEAEYLNKICKIEKPSFFNNINNSYNTKQTTKQLSCSLLELQYFQIKKQIENIKNSNFLLTPNYIDSFDLICLLNLNDTSLDKINKSFFDKKQNIESKYIELYYQQDNITFLSCDYIYINF